MTLYEGTFTEMVSDTFVICKHIKRISAKKKLVTPKSKTPLDTLRSMSSALCIFMQLTFSSMLHRILTERIIEKMVTTLHGIVKYFVCVLQKVNDFEFT